MDKEIELAKGISIKFDFNKADNKEELEALMRMSLNVLNLFKRIDNQISEASEAGFSKPEKISNPNYIGLSAKIKLFLEKNPKISRDKIVEAMSGEYTKTQIFDNLNVLRRKGFIKKDYSVQPPMVTLLKKPKYESSTKLINNSSRSFKAIVLDFIREKKQTTSNEIVKHFAKYKPDSVYATVGYLQKINLIKKDKSVNPSKIIYVGGN